MFWLLDSVSVLLNIKYSIQHITVNQYTRILLTLFHDIVALGLFG